MNTPTKDKIEVWARIDATLDAYRALSKLYPKADAAWLEGDVIDAVNSGRPAYFTMATYNNQLAMQFAAIANKVNLSAAVAHVDRKQDDTIRHSQRDWMLASLIPLGPDARAEIDLARGTISVTHYLLIKSAALKGANR